MATPVKLLRLKIPLNLRLSVSTSFIHSFIDSLTNMPGILLGTRIPKITKAHLLLNNYST